VRSAVLIAVGLSLRLGYTDPTTTPSGLAVRELPTLQVSTLPSEASGKVLQHRSQYYGVYEQTRNQKLGWYFSQQEPSVLDKQLTIKFLNRSEVSFLQEGRIRKNTIEEEFHFARTPPYPLIQLKLREQKAASIRQVTLKRSRMPGTYRAMIVEGKTIREESLAGLQLTAADFLAASAWATSRRPSPGQQLRVAALDVRELVPYVEVCTQLPVEPTQPQWHRVSCENLTNGGKSIYCFDEQGMLQQADLDGATTLRCETKSEALKIPPPLDLHQQSIVPSDTKLGDVFKLKELQLTLHGAAASAHPHLPETERQRLLAYTDASISLHLSPDQGLARICRLEDKTKALQASASLPISHPTIQQLTKDAIGQAATAQEKVAKLIRFVQAYLKDDTAAEPLGIWDILKQRRGDCTEHALLFTVLARAADIPCREVTGYFYLGDNQQAFGGHAWNEVVIDGKWHEVDPTWGLTTVTPAHILLSSGKATLREMRFLVGGNKIRVDKATY
jgi:hypothetical protein